MRPDFVFVISTCFWLLWALIFVLLFDLFWFFVAAVGFVGILWWFWGVGGSHLLHFHVSFGLSVWFWN